MINTPFTSKDYSQFVKDVSHIIQKIQIYIGVNEIRVSDSSTVVAADVLTSSTMSLCENDDEEEKGNKVTIFLKQLISALLILISYEIVDRNVARAPS